MSAFHPLQTLVSDANVSAMNVHLLSFAFAVLSACHQSDAQAENGPGLLPPLPAIAEPQAHPPAKLLDRIERLVRLPAGAEPLNAYRRYYSVDKGDASKPRRIVAIYTTLANSRGRQWVSPVDLPMILDGGCSVVQVVYAVAEDKIISATCNGHA